VRLLPEPRHGRFLSASPDWYRSSDDPSLRRQPPKLVSSGQNLSTKPRPESRMPVKVTRWPDPGRLPSPCRSHRAVLRSRSGCDPGSGSILDVASSEGLGHLAVVPSSRLGPICPPRCLPRGLLGPTSPDDFCSLSRPADTSANPDPRRRAAGVLRLRPSANPGTTPRTAGGRPGRRWMRGG